MHEDPHTEPLSKGGKARTRFFAIVPAAGRSARMGMEKLTLPFGGRPLLASVLQSWSASRVDAVLLVVHPEDTALAEIGRQFGAIVVVPLAPPPDMKSSVLQGLRHLQQHLRPADADAWLVAPADMPLLTSAAIDSVLSAFESSHESIVVPCFEGRRGHPVAFPWALSGEVARLAHDQGLNALLARYPVRQVEVASRGILTDVDTPEDYRRLANGGTG